MVPKPPGSKSIIHWLSVQDAKRHIMDSAGLGSCSQAVLQTLSRPKWLDWDFTGVTDRAEEDDGRSGSVKSGSRQWELDKKSRGLSEKDEAGFWPSESQQSPR